MLCSVYSPEVFRESSSAGHSEKQAMHLRGSFARKANREARTSRDAVSPPYLIPTHQPFPNCFVLLGPLRQRGRM